MKLPVHQLCDGLHHRGHSEMHRIRDGAVTRMTLMSAAAFAVEQIGVDSDGSVTGPLKTALEGDCHAELQDRCQDGLARKRRRNRRMVEKAFPIETEPLSQAAWWMKNS